eukprot:2061971-Alexandrium_andersonii.AAC.1
MPRRPWRLPWPPAASDTEAGSAGPEQQPWGRKGGGRARSGSVGRGALLDGADGRSLSSFLRRLPRALGGGARSRCTGGGGKGRRKAPTAGGNPSRGSMLRSTGHGTLQ